MSTTGSDGFDPRLGDSVARCGPTAALALDRDGRILFVNEILEQLLGHPAADLVGRRAWDLLHPDDRDDLARRGILSADELGPSVDVGPGTPPGAGPPPAGAPTTLVRVRDGRGAWRWMEATTTDMGAGADPGGMVVHLYDVTRWRRRAAALSERGLRDPLTGAANHILLHDRLSHALLRGPRSGRPRVAVLFCDLDGFKAVNDVLGHAAGDALLIEAHRRLRRIVRPPDTVARPGGDEFVLCCEDVDGADAVGLARRIRSELTAPFQVGDRTVRLSASIGVAIAESAQQPARDLVRDADRAMYAAKSRGPDRIVVHDEALRAELSAQDAGARALRHAVEHGELRLRHLPRVHLRRRQVVGTDAQVCWQHPDDGLVGSERFRDLAFRIGLDPVIGEWALAEACRQHGARRHGSGRKGRVWVDLGPGRLGIDLVPTVRRALAAGGLPAHRLGLGIPGSDLAGLGRGSDRATGPGPHRSPTLAGAVSRGAAIGALGRLGVHLSVDDLPGDPAALRALRRGAVRLVTVPRSIVSGLGARSEHTAVARGLVSMAHSLDIRAHAVGVATPAQADVLADLGCETASGPLFADLAPAAGAPSPRA